MGIGDRIKGVSRRDFFRIAGTYGLSNTLLAAGAFGGAMTAANLASAAESTYERRFSKDAKFTLKFGAAGFNPSATTRSVVRCHVLRKHSRASSTSMRRLHRTPLVAHLT